VLLFKLIVLFISLSFTAFSQVVMMTVPYLEKESVVYADDFTGDVGNLDDRENWLNDRPSEDIVIYNNSGDNVIKGGYTYYAYCAYDAVLNSDHWAEIKVDNIGSGFVGIIVRYDSSTGKYYLFMSDNSGSRLRIVQNGSALSLFASGSAWQNGSVYRLEVVGYELRCYKDGVLDTSIDGDGKYTVGEPYKIDGNKAGVVTYSTGTSMADDWKASSL